MKTIIFLFFAGIAATGLLLAQGKIASPNPSRMSSNPMTYDPKSPPPVSLPEAYALALGHIGAATNRFHCVTASCLERTNSGWAGWVFTFGNTNNQRARVVVFYDKRPWTDRYNSDVEIK